MSQGALDALLGHHPAAWTPSPVHSYLLISVQEARLTAQDDIVHRCSLTAMLRKGSASRWQLC